MLVDNPCRGMSVHGYGLETEGRFKRNSHISRSCIGLINRYIYV